MISFLVAEILGKEYLVVPGKELVVDFLGDIKKYECDKVLLISKDNKVSMGSPYLKDKIQFEVIESFKGRKTRVATYKAKANTRKVKGFRPMLTKIKFNP